MSDVIIIAISNAKIIIFNADVKRGTMINFVKS